MQDQNQANRRFLVNMSLRRVQPGAGSSVEHFTKRNWRLPVSDINDIFRTTPFVVCGGVATRAYSAERETEDLDVLIRKSQADLAYQELEAAGSSYVGELSVPGSHWILPDQTNLDVLESSSAWADEAIRNPNRNNPFNLPIMPLPYLVLMKLQASRMIDLADISRMMGQADEVTRNETRQLVKKYLPSASEDLEGLIYLGQLELQQPSKRTSSYREVNRQDDISKGEHQTENRSHPI